ncbi:DUF1800 domain-containing protein [Bordetella sp. 2513F-2]
MTMLRRFYLSLPAWLLAGFLATSTAATVSDEAWLGRVAYSATPEALQEVKQQGREAYLEKQLNPPESDDLPAPVAAYVEKLERTTEPPLDSLVRARELVQKMKDVSPPEAAKLRTTRAKELQQYRKEASERSVLRATFSPWQLREQLTWFWFNHFNVFMSKGSVGYALADYEDTLRKNALGNFRDILEASLKHPAMLIYLDNNVSTKEKPNENYARELMELHTLGVDGGYSQEDVQALARILTGVRVMSNKTAPKMPKKLQGQLIQEGAFVFDPRHHDFSDKKFLGKTIKGQGWAEVDQVLDILATHPSTAKHVARRLAIYLVSDNPPDAVVEQAAKTFAETKGDIKATVKSIVESDTFAEAAGKQFKSPMQYAISSVQAAGIKNPDRVVKVVRQALSQMGQPLYGRLTPDGYPLEGESWISTGQLANRMAIAENVAGIRGGGGTAPGQAKAAGQKVSMQTEGNMRTSEESKAQSTKDSASPRQKQLFMQLAGPSFMYR